MIYSSDLTFVFLQGNSQKDFTEQVLLRIRKELPNNPNEAFENLTKYVPNGMTFEKCMENANNTWRLKDP
ncbi:hypothetical protein BpHYR1_014660 [Brachionus plicatilis]|uniref:Uncharacterized protein n=1 Tax=Brachionus plicatilis TaxID=10195 RepID=A0A3M7P663_BRAPC|nr:hypothetical protein BpHYR1_014660 [Brachionus plicatilis]